MPPNPKDTLYQDSPAHPGGFRFDQATVEVFGDMIRRSVPGYEATATLSAILAERFVRPKTRVYDLGASLLEGSLAVQSALLGQDFEIVALDNSAEMIEAARARIPTNIPAPAIRLVHQDLKDATLENASLVLLNYTLQFLPPADRLGLLTRIHRGLRPGGALILSEKVSLDSDWEEELQTDLHHRFKRLQGYSELEIHRKRTALEDVLIPESVAVHRKRLEEAGFDRVTVWFQCFRFVSLVALRDEE